MRPRRAASPLHAAQIRADDMAEVSGLFVADVVREVSPISDDDVGAVDCFAGEPRIQPKGRLIWRR